MNKEIRKIIKQIQEGYKPEQIILFGSHAYGNARDFSDVDLAIIKKTKDRFWDRIRKINRLINSEMGTDILVYTPQEWNRRLAIGDYFVEEIIRKGKVVYEKQ